MTERDPDPDTQALLRGDYDTYYRLQGERIRRMAADHPDVRYTLSWSLDLLRDMAAGRVEPVRPKPRVHARRQERRT